MNLDTFIRNKNIYTSSFPLAGAGSKETTQYPEFSIKMCVCVCVFIYNLFWGVRVQIVLS